MKAAHGGSYADRVDEARRPTVFSLRLSLAIGVLALAALAALPSAVDAASARSAAIALSPVDGQSWAPPQGGWAYRFRTYKTGIEMDSDSGGPLSNRCVVKVGTPFARYLPVGGDLYRASYQVFHVGKGGVGPTGSNCTTHWTPATAKVVIAVFNAKDKYGIEHPTMTISCYNKPTKVCLRLTHL